MMDNRSRNDISIRIRRHQSLPVQLPCHPSPLRRRNTASSASSSSLSSSSVLLINRRLGATKNNPYIGSFRHAPPTSLRSMEATSSSLSSLSSAITARIHDTRMRMGKRISTPTSTSPSTSDPISTTGRGRSSSLSSYFSPSLSPSASSSSAATLMVQHAHVHVPAMKNSPYVGWFRHAPNSSSISSSSTSTMKKKKKQKNHHFDIHKVDLDALTELDRWHDQLTLLLVGVIDHHHHVVDGSGLDDHSSNSGSCKNKIPLFVLKKIINGRLVGGSGKDRQQKKVMMPPSEMMHPFRSNDDDDNGNTCTALSRLTSWLQHSALVYDDDDDCSCINDDHQKTGDGLKLIDDDDDDDDDDDSSRTSSSSSTSSYDYDPVTATAGRGRGDGNYTNSTDHKAEIEKEFAEMNVSASEIAETYDAHEQLLIDEEHDNTNANDATMHPLRSAISRGIRGVDTFTSTHYDSEYDHTTRTNIHRLDYEITQMDIARMARNASRHLDVDSILTLPTIIYRRNHHRHNNNKKKKQQQLLQASLSSTAEILPEVTTTDADQSYHHVCTPINEDHSNTSSNTNDSLSSFSSTSRNNKINDDSSNGNDDKDDNDALHSTEEEGWSFLMVNGVKSMVQNVVMMTRKDENKNKDSILSQHQKKQQIEDSKSESESDAAAATTTERKNHNEDDDDDDAVDVDDVCVICLEVFRDGDRLRVLPCDHSFHAGCIDRWLSGSHSYHECFTAGCPTCKKLPHASFSSSSNKKKKKKESTTTGRYSTIIVDGEDDDKSDDSSMTGSVPSWAFANLGSVMAMSSGDLPSP